MKKKILFVTTRFIYPVNDGRKVVLYNYCKGLSEQLGYEVSLFAFVDKKERQEKQPDFISKIYYGEVPGLIEKAKNVLLKSIILRKWPLQVSVYYSKKSNKNLLKAIDEYKPDIVICDMARTAEYLKNLDGDKYNKILDMDDLISKRYLRQLNSNSVSASAIGAYSKKLPKFLNKLTNCSFIMKNVLKMEAHILSKYEIEISKFYNHIVFVSPIETVEFNQKIKSNKSTTITIGVDYNYFSKQIGCKKLHSYIGYLGNMYVAHNKDAVYNFIENIFPIILKEKPNAVFRIIGRCPKELIDKYKDNKNIEVTGEVDDIRKYMQECEVSVAPFIYGTGIKTKILETMAMGVPVVTNSIGKEGLNLTNGLNIIVENDDVNIAKQILALLSDSSMRDKISENASEYVKVNHQWNDIIEKFENIL